MKVTNHVFFYEDCNATKDSGSLIEFFIEGGWLKETDVMTDIVSYPVVGGVVIEEKLFTQTGVEVIQIIVMWEKRSSQSFLN
jgi:hypothetical protein